MDRVFGREVLRLEEAGDDDDRLGWLSLRQKDCAVPHESIESDAQEAAVRKGRGLLAARRRRSRYADR